MTREIYVVGFAGLLSLVATRVLPLSSADAFRGTVALLPLVVALFWAINRWTIRQGGRAISSQHAEAVISALCILVLLIIGRQQLGLRYSAVVVDGVLAGGLALLLLFHAREALLALRPLLGTRLPKKLPAVFFVLPWVCYIAILPWSAERRQPNGDEPYYLLMAHSLAYDFDAELSNNYTEGSSLHFMDQRIEPQRRDPTGPQGQIYSRHSALLSLFLAPFYRLGGLAAALVVMAALTAATAYLTLKVARHYVPAEPGAALLAFGILALFPPLVLYSYQFWVEVPAALLLILGVDGVHRLNERSGRWTAWLSVLASVLLLPFLKMRFVLLAATILLLAAWRFATNRKRVLFLGGLVAALALVGSGILIYNAATYGNPLRTHKWQELTTLHQRDPVRFLLGGIGLLFDCAFGLAGTAPIWMLLIPAIALCCVVRRRLVTDFAIVFGLYLFALLPRPVWYGEWSPPFRYGLVMLPFASLFLIPLLQRRDRALTRIVVDILGLLTTLLTTLWLALPNWTYNFAHGRSHLLDQLSTRLGADVSRFFPSAIRTRPATWLWPLAVVVALGAIWVVRRRARGRSLGAAATGLLLLSTTLPIASHRVPTAKVELEDPYIRRQGGELFPPLWTRLRIRHRGGWKLQLGDSVSIPVSPGGSRVSLVLTLRRLGTSDARPVLVLRAEDRVLARRPIGGRQEWRTMRIDNLPWEAEEHMVISFGPESAGSGDQPELIIDNISLDWQSRQ